MASPTDRVIAQTVSSVVDRGSAPAVGVSRAVFLKPTTPHRAAGMRIEPPVSEPSPTKAAPVATETAAPEEEPPGMRGVAGSAGLAGVPKWGLMPTPENANSDMLVRPRMAPPAARRRATAGLSQVAGGASASTVEPAAVVSPAMSNRSLTEQARPASGRAALAGFAATARAESKLVFRKAFSQAVDPAMAIDASISCAAVVSPLSSRSRVALRSGRMGGGSNAIIFGVLLGSRRMVRLRGRQRNKSRIRTNKVLQCPCTRAAISVWILDPTFRNSHVRHHA